METETARVTKLIERGRSYPGKKNHGGKIQNLYLAPLKSLLTLGLDKVWNCRIKEEVAGELKDLNMYFSNCHHRGVELLNLRKIDVDSTLGCCSVNRSCLRL